MASDLEICNAALMRLGNEPIASFSDNSKRAKLCDAHYERIKRDLIADNPWNFSLKRAELVADKSDFVSGDVDTVTDQITITNHGADTGDRVFLSGSGLPVPLSAKSYYVIRVDKDIIQLAESHQDALNESAIDLTATGAGTLQYAALFDFSFRFEIPGDYLTIFRVEPDYQEYQVEGQKIYSDGATFKMIYQAAVKEKDFSIYFQQALILKLAVEFSYTLIQSNELKTVLVEEAERALRHARLKDSQEGTPYPMTADAWTRVRQ